MAVKKVGTEKNLINTAELGAELPIYACGEFHLLDMPQTPKGKWSGKQPPPAIGDRVVVNFNGFGPATVLDYFVEAGWLGVEVKLDKQPEWHRKQNGRQTCIKVFGLEIDPSPGVRGG